VRTCLLLVLLLALAGCGGSTPLPTLSGGKPVSYWIEELHNKDAAKRKHAVAKLGNVGPADPATLPAIVAELNDKDASVRREAIMAVVKFGTKASDAVPILTRLRDHDPDNVVRRYSVEALAKIKEANGAGG